jgi:NAD(P)-dependent dehydrogenase (short-subunit alcohol dehydrogenase family)
MNLDGKVAVVTGAAHGLGAAVARRFAAEGARVVVTDVEADPLHRMAGEIAAVALAADITSEASVHAVADLALKTYGQIDIWHSNAGLAGPRQPGDLQQNELWEQMWQLHVMSHVYAARAVLPSMMARGDGYLLATASAVALATQLEKVAYAVTKCGLLALCEWLAATYRPKGVKVSCLCPGPMLTRIFLSNGFPDDSPAVRTALSPEQAADVVVGGIEAEKFLILTHPGSETGLAEKSADYDGWLESVGTGWGRMLPSQPVLEAESAGDG